MPDPAPWIAESPLLTHAYGLAERAHRSQRRPTDGRPFISHVTEVARTASSPSSRLEVQRFLLDEALGMEAMLLGRITYEEPPRFWQRLARGDVRPRRIAGWRIRGPVQQPPKVRRLIDPRGSRVDNSTVLEGGVTSEELS